MYRFGLELLFINKFSTCSKVQKPVVLFISVFVVIFRLQSLSLVTCSSNVANVSLLNTIYAISFLD